MITTRNIQAALKTARNTVISRIPAAIYACLQDSARTIQNQPEIVLIYTTACVTTFGVIGNFIDMHNVPSPNMAYHFEQLERTTTNIIDVQKWIEEYTLTPFFPNENFVKGIMIGAAVGIFAGIIGAKSRSKEYAKKMPNIKIEKPRPNETEPHLVLSYGAPIGLSFWPVIHAISESSTDFEIFFLKHLFKHISGFPDCVINFPRSDKSMIESYLTCKNEDVQDSLTRAATKFARQSTFGITVNPLTAMTLILLTGFAVIWKLENHRKKKESKLETAQQIYVENYRKKLN